MTDERPGALRLFNALVGVTTLLVLLQGLWAGLFVREGEGYDEDWVGWHSVGGQVTIVLMLVATVAVFAKLRERRDLCIGGAVTTGLLVVETALGMGIGGNGDLTTVHVPLAMLLMAALVYLATRGATRSTS